MLLDKVVSERFFLKPKTASELLCARVRFSVVVFFI